MLLVRCAACAIGALELRRAGFEKECACMFVCSSTAARKELSRLWFPHISVSPGAPIYGGSIGEMGNGDRDGGDRGGLVIAVVISRIHGMRYT